MTRDERTRSEDLPVLSKRGVTLPAWSVGIILAAIVFVVSLGVEARGELSHQREKIGDLKDRITKLEETNAEAIAGMRNALGKVQLSLARICQQVKAECPQ